MKKHLLLIPLILLCFFMGGCFDMAEVSQQIYVIAIGMDKSESGLEITLKTINPSSFSSNGTEQEPFKDIVLDMPSLSEAVEKIELSTEKKLNFDNVDVIILGDGLCRQEDFDIRASFDFFFRQLHLRRGAQIAVTEGRVVDFFNDENFNSELSTQYLEQLLSLYHKRNSSTGGTALYSVLRTSANNLDFYLVRVEKPKDEDIAVVGAALFSNGRLVGELTVKELESLCRLSGSRQIGTIEITQEEYSDAKGLYFKYENYETKITPSLIGGLKFSTQINAICTVSENNNGYFYFTEDRIIRLQEILAEKIKEEIEALRKNTLDEQNVDAIGYLNLMRLYHNDWWKETEGKDRMEIIKTAEFNYNVTVTIQRIGQVK